MKKRTGSGNVTPYILPYVSLLAREPVWKRNLTYHSAQWPGKHPIPLLTERRGETKFF